MLNYKLRLFEYSLIIFQLGKRKSPLSSEDEKKDDPVKSNNKKDDYSKKHKKIFSEKALTGVVFALSGFQNPLRSEIRDTGLKLGAKYRPDWTDDCTHLVSAFSNTPKASQVKKSGGKIVTKEWIFDCEKQEKN